MLTTLSARSGAAAKCKSWLCTAFGHKRGPEEDGDAFTLGHLKLVNRVAPCVRCGARLPSGVVVETPEGHRSPLRARSAV